MARKHKPEATPETTVHTDPHHGKGGSYYNPGGVNHDVEQEPEKQLVERTDDKPIRSVEDANASNPQED